MCSAGRLVVYNVCVTFHENMSSSFKVMERTRKLLTDTHTYTQQRRKLYTPMAYFVCLFATVLCLNPENARKKKGNGLAAGCHLFYRKIYGYFLQCSEFNPTIFQCLQ